MNSIDNTQLQTVYDSNFMGDILASQRRRLFARFLEFKQDGSETSTLTVARAEHRDSDSMRLLAASNSPHESAEASPKQAEPANAARLSDFRYEIEQRALESKSCPLPFADAEFDWVFCDAVIEHIGPLERQYLLLKELSRVARRGIFVSTVNRWHPLEFHTGLPLIHWLPASWWRRALSWLGMLHFSPQSQLNLLGSKELTKLANLLPSRPTFSIGHIRFLGIKASFFLQIRKQPLDG